MTYTVEVLPRYEVLSYQHGFSVWDNWADASCLGLWSLHEANCQRWADALNAAHASFVASSWYAKRNIDKECE